MNDEITISKTLSIRDCGLKEAWLQDQIEKDPSFQRKDAEAPSRKAYFLCVFAPPCPAAASERRRMRLCVQ
jgi:hypothetical protein